MAEEIFDPLRRTLEGAASGVASGVGDLVGGVSRGLSPITNAIGEAYTGFQNMPEDRKMMLLSTLGKTGAALMALGAPGYNPKLKQQAMMALGNIPSQVSTERYKLAQAKLMQATQQARLAQMKDIMNFSAWRKTPEGISALSKLGFSQEIINNAPSSVLIDQLSKMKSPTDRAMSETTLKTAQAQLQSLENDASLAKLMREDPEAAAARFNVSSELVKRAGGSPSVLRNMIARLATRPQTMFELFKKDPEGASAFFRAQNQGRQNQTLEAMRLFNLMNQRVKQEQEAAAATPIGQPTPSMVPPPVATRTPPASPSPASPSPASTPSTGGLLSDQPTGGSGRTTVDQARAIGVPTSNLRDVFGFGGTMGAFSRTVGGLAGTQRTKGQEAAGESEAYIKRLNSRLLDVFRSDTEGSARLSSITKDLMDQLARPSRFLTNPDNAINAYGAAASALVNRVNQINALLADKSISYKQKEKIRIEGQRANDMQKELYLVIQNLKEGGLRNKNLNWNDFNKMYPK